MANLIIKSSADNLVLQGSDASPAITVGATGTTTFAENATFSGTANNLGTTTAGTLGSAVTGDAFKNGTCFFIGNFSTDTGWASLSQGDPIPFSNIKVDDDSCCSVTGGTVRFTAPATGWYLFGHSIYTAQSDTSNSFIFYVDNSTSYYSVSADFGVGIIDTGDSTADKTESMSRIYKLTASQYVTANASTDSDYYAGHSSWHGCRLG